MFLKHLNYLLFIQFHRPKTLSPICKRKSANYGSEKLTKDSKKLEFTDDFKFKMEFLFASKLRTNSKARTYFNATKKS